MAWRDVWRRWMGNIVSPPRVGVASTMRAQQAQIEEIVRRLTPPESMSDPAAWDRHWQLQFEARWIDTADIFCHDGPIVEGMRQSGLRTVLCVGNGLAQEPLALAAAGFDVTALDLSPYATELASTATPPRDLLSRFIGGQFADGGQVRFVAGDLRNPDVCPGPFDVVIERRTLQLFPDAERPAALEAVAARLGSRGLFVSHSHDGRWRPPAPRRHWTRAWFEERAWVEWTGGPLDGRACYLVCTTG